MKRDLTVTAGVGGALCLWCAVLTSGCDSRGENEREFLNTAPPGVAPANPDESYAAKRGRMQEAAKQSRSEGQQSKRTSRRDR